MRVGINHGTEVRKFPTQAPQSFQMEAEAGGEEDFWTGVITIEECEELNLKVGGEVRERRQVMHLWRRVYQGVGQG